MKEIADVLGLDASTVNRQVNSALKSGLVERCSPTGGARPIRPTEAGRAGFEADLLSSLATTRAGLDALPAGRAEEFLALFATFVEGYRAAAEAAHGPAPQTR